MANIIVNLDIRCKQTFKYVWNLFTCLPDTGIFNYSLMVVSITRMECYSQSPALTNIEHIFLSDVVVKMRHDMTMSNKS